MIRARVQLRVLRDTIQPFPNSSEFFPAAQKALSRETKQVNREGKPLKV